MQEITLGQQVKLFRLLKFNFSPELEFQHKLLTIMTEGTAFIFLPELYCTRLYFTNYFYFGNLGIFLFFVKLRFNETLTNLKIYTFITIFQCSANNW